ncbi:methyltransferase-like protein 27 [Ptychodera flava]|uniref:methyltransferase-like protein 27 n=1 Tax=Ptychodera flava TaxID=63121 RepID=UPI00396A5F0E
MNVKDCDAEETLKDIRNLDEKATSTEVKEFYDKWSHRYDEDCIQLGWYGPKHVAVGLSKLVPGKNARILDCAAGTGLVGQELKRLGYERIDALDISLEILDKAREKLIYENVICAKLGPDPIAGIHEDSYDAVVCSGAFGIGHLDDGCFLEWIRILKKGGVICIAANVDDKQAIEGPVLSDLLENGSLELIQKCHLNTYVKNLKGTYYAFKK